MWNWLRRRRSSGDDALAVDLGTAMTRVWGLDGDVREVPSRVGQKTESARRPRHGAMGVDVDATTWLLKSLLPVRHAPRVLACAPSQASGEERSALTHALGRAGAREVLLVPEPLAAAIGAGLDVASPYAQLLVDVGDGLTDGAVVAGGELVATFTVPLGCSDLRHALRRHLLARHALRLDEEASDALVRRVGTQRCERGGEYLRVAGRDLGEQPHHVWISRKEALSVMEPVVARILERVQGAVRALPEDVGTQVIESGLCLTGGGAQLPGLPERLRDASGLDVRVAGDPCHAAIRGAHEMLRRSIAAESAWPVSAGWPEGVARL